MKPLIVSAFLLGATTACHRQGYIELNNLENSNPSPVATSGGLVFIGLGVPSALIKQDFNFAVYGGTDSANLILIKSISGGPGGNVAIPATIAGMPVTAIGAQAFLGRTSLTAITIPDSVTNIEDGFLSRGGGLGAFGFCNALTNVSMGNGVLYIGIGTFALCRRSTRARGTMRDQLVTCLDSEQIDSEHTPGDVMPLATRKIRNLRSRRSPHPTGPAHRAGIISIRPLSRHQALGWPSAPFKIKA